MRVDRFHRHQLAADLAGASQPIGPSHGSMDAVPMDAVPMDAVRRGWSASIVLSDLASDGRAECFAHAFDGDSIKDLLEESSDDHADRFTAREPARLSVKNQLLVDTTAGATVGASHIVRVDFQPGDGIGAGGIAEHQVVIALVPVGLLGSFADLDHPAPHGSRAVLQHGLVQEVAGAMRGDVMLQCVVDQVLAVAGEHDTVDLGPGTGFDQGHPLVDLSESATHGGYGPLKGRIATYAGPLVSEMPSVLTPVLEIDISQVRPGTLDDFDRSAVEPGCCFAGTGRFEEDGGFGTFLQNDQRMR